VGVKPDKEKIEIHFARAATSYENQAMVQKRIGGKLIGLMEEHMDVFQGRALEIGCCTGMLTSLFLARFPLTYELHVNDLVSGFAPLFETLDTKRRIRFIGGDIESVSLPATYDCIFSSSTFHWLHDVKSCLERLHGHLRPGGLLAFTLYGPKNMSEIRELTGQGLRYHSLADMCRMLAEKYTVYEAAEGMEKLCFAEVRDILDHLRATGVNALTTKGWNRAQLLSFSRRYADRFGTESGIPLTYHPMYFIARPR
jgi:malonyl-ACP O-methyltransferase BioC